MAKADRIAIRRIFPGVSDADLDEADQHLLQLERAFPNLVWTCRWQGNFFGVHEAAGVRIEVDRIGGFGVTLTLPNYILRSKARRRQLADALADFKATLAPIIAALG